MTSDQAKVHFNTLQRTKSLRRVCLNIVILAYFSQLQRAIAWSGRQGSGFGIPRVYFLAKPSKYSPSGLEYWGCGHMRLVLRAWPLTHPKTRIVLGGPEGGGVIRWAVSVTPQCCQLLTHSLSYTAMPHQDDRPVGTNYEDKGPKPERGRYSKTNARGPIIWPRPLLLYLYC